MKRTILLLAALLWHVCAAAQSRIESFTVQSELLGCEKPCTVYLPDGYDTSDRQYPVLYLLHGASGCHTNWVDKGNMRQIADEAIAEGRAAAMIVVMPDASGEGENFTGRHMGYFDVPGWPYEQFFFREFLPAVEAHYRILADKQHRAIAGLSMGGGGSAVYAMHHPELFGAACPLSGLLDLRPGERNFEDAFTQSVIATSPVRMLETLPDEQIAPLRTVRWRVDCGDDDFLYLCNVRFYCLMRRRGIPLEYRMRDGGHTWRYWQTALPDVLTFVSAAFTR